MGSLGGVLGNRTSECLSGTRLGSTQHPLKFLRTHSRASLHKKLAFSQEQIIRYFFANDKEIK